MLQVTRPSAGASVIMMKKDSSSENDMNVVNQAEEPGLSPEKKENGEKSRPSLISPRQRQRMMASQLKAKITRVSRQLPLISPTIGPTWFSALEGEFEKPYFQKLSNALEDERSRYTVYPGVDEVWSWTTRTPIQETRVVILGRSSFMK